MGSEMCIRDSLSDDQLLQKNTPSKMCKDIADKLLSFHLQSRCDICKTQAAESKQVRATVQPPYAPCFTHTCSCNPPQNPYPVGAALFHKGGQGRSEVRPLAQGHYQEVTRPTFRFMSVEFFPPHSIGQRQQEHLTLLLIQPMVNSETCFYIKNRKRY